MTTMVYNSDNFVVVELDVPVAPRRGRHARSQRHAALARRLRDRRQVRAQGDLHRGRAGAAVPRRRGGTRAQRADAGPGRGIHRPLHRPAAAAADPALIRFTPAAARDEARDRRPAAAPEDAPTNVRFVRSGLRETCDMFSASPKVSLRRPPKQRQCLPAGSAGACLVSAIRRAPASCRNSSCLLPWPGRPAP